MTKKNQQHLPAYIFYFAWFYRRQPLQTYFECFQLNMYTIMVKI